MPARVNVLQRRGPMGGMDWKGGYVADASYANTFVRELSPAWLSYVRALSGAGPFQLDRPFKYLELGCGLAQSIVVNAASFPAAEFHACELNPQHVAAGRAYASALGATNLHFHETSFRELRLDDLPRFDFIVMHGVYSWIDAENRAAIRRVVRDRLAPEGLVYISYNCMPGWSSELPLRRFMLEVASGAAGESIERMQHALAGLQQLRRGRVQFFETHPAAAQAVELYGKLPSNYLVHEFLNECWEPFYSIDIAAEMAQLGLTFLASATLADNHPMLIMDDPTAQAIAAFARPRERQLATDFATDRRFRRDVFIRSEKAPSPAEISRSLYSAIIGCVEDPRTIGTKAKVPRGYINFDEDFICKLRDVLTPRSMSVGDAIAQLGGPGRNPIEITRNLVFLVASGVLMPFAQAQSLSRRTEMSRSLAPMLQRTLAYAMETQTARAVPSEILGNGVLISPAEAAALTKILAGDPLDPAEGRLARDLLPTLTRLDLCRA